MRTAAAAALLLTVLAACVPPPPPEPPVSALQPGDVVGGDLGQGLVQQEPDLCGLSSYQQYAGQPGTTVQALTFSRPFRVVEFGGIVTQEYDPSRVNFFLDPAGTIVRIACG